VILTQLPDLPPRPETPRNAAFRREFYRLWGKENAIVSGAAHRAEYGVYRQTLSIKMVAGGSEHYYVDRRRLTVTDETYLVLNEGREYSSVLQGPADAYSFCLFFRPNMTQDIAGAVATGVERALDAGRELAPRRVEFTENLRPHDSVVTPVMRFIRRHVEQGVEDPEWYEEQFQYLLARLIRAQDRSTAGAERIECLRASKRKELLKRLGWATDYAHSNLHQPLTLNDMARAATLSSFHFLRLFRQLHGVTPMTYLRSQRAQRAVALLTTTPLDVSEISELVGMSRMTLWRALQDMHGEGPKKLRQRLQEMSTQAHSSQ
jgi:AraC family transcriptional regulator